MEKQADFYILADNTQHARVGFLIKLLTQIQPRGLNALILVDDQSSAEELDQQLWDYRPDTFLPHRLLGSETTAFTTIAHLAPALPTHDVLINLQSKVELVNGYPRIVEIVIQDDTVLTSTRLRYQHYREQGWTLNRHDMRKPK